MDNSYDLSGLLPEDKDLIIQKLAPQLMKGQLDGSSGQEPEGDEHSACVDTFKLHEQAIFMLAQALDEIQEKLGITNQFKDVIDSLMELADESIKQQEMQEMEEKLGSIYGPYSDKYSALSQGKGNLKDTMYNSIKELQKRPDYHDGMPEMFVKDKMGEFQKMLDGLTGGAASPEGAVSVEKTTVAPKAAKGMNATIPEVADAAPEEPAEGEETPDAFGLTPSKIAELQERATKARALAASAGKKKTKK